jgi:hypothetical protein
MAVDPRDLTELAKLEQAMPEHGGLDLTMLDSVEEVIAWLITDARASGDNEVDRAELLIRYADMSPDEVRSAERVLRRLGYRAVADMMRRIAGRTRLDLKPL